MALPYDRDVRATAFDVVNSSNNEIEVYWTNALLNAPYYTNEVFPSPQEYLNEYNASCQSSANMPRIVRYDDGYPVIHPLGIRKNMRLEEQPLFELDRHNIGTLTNPQHKCHKKNNMSKNSDQIKSAESRAKIVSKEERTMRTDISKKEHRFRGEMKRKLDVMKRIERDAVEAQISMKTKLEQYDEYELSQRAVIDWDREIQIGTLDKQMKQQKRLVLREEGQHRKVHHGDVPLTKNKEDPRYIVKMLATPNMGTLHLMLPYLKEEKCRECDHVITAEDYYTGQHLLRDALEECYKTLKLKVWGEENALGFMTLLSKLHASETDLTEIREQTANVMDEKYKDRLSARIAMRYFHNSCSVGVIKFNSSTYSRLHGEESQVISVTLDYFVHLFHALFTRTVDQMQPVVQRNTSIWNGQLPIAVLQELQRRMNLFVNAIQKDIERTLEMQREYQRTKERSETEQQMDQIFQDINDDLAAIHGISEHHAAEQITERRSRSILLKAEASARNVLETRLTMPIFLYLFDHLRYNFVDLSIIEIIRDWIEAQHGSGGTICVAVDEIDRQMLEALLTHFDDIKLEKYKVSQLNMPAWRGGRARSKTKWRFERVPMLGLKSGIGDASTETIDNARKGAKQFNRRKGGKNKK